jgi:glycosyltransferase involved in cell wall biosynthesis
MAPVKRMDLFLAAAEHIAQALPEARFVIVGEGQERSRLQHRADQSKVSERVYFLGHRDDIYDVLRAFDVFLMCSDHEGLPMALLEALHLGVPVVARGIGGVREVMEHGVNGLLVDSDQAPALAEACLRVLQEDGLRSRLADAGRRTVNERFNVAMTAARVAELYESLCEAAKR